MACCCNRTLQLCTVSVCGENPQLKTGINAAATGTHILVFDFLGVQYRIEAAINIGEEIIFPIGELNENYHFTAQVLDPDGEVIEIEQGEDPDTVIYDCIGFKTVVSFTITEPAP